MLTFATKKLPTGANGQKEDAASFICQRSFDQAVMKASNVSFFHYVILLALEPSLLLNYWDL